MEDPYQEVLNEAAADLAERFFTEPPRDFGARIDSWINEWTAARSSSAAEAFVS